MGWWTTLKANFLLIVGAVIAGLVGVIKYQSMKVKSKESEIDKLTKSIDTAVEVNKTNAEVTKKKQVIDDEKNSVDSAGDDDVDRLLLNKYTRNNYKG